VQLCHLLYFFFEQTEHSRAPGRVIAQAVSRRLPTAAARVRAEVRSGGIYGGQSGIGAGSLRVLRFPLTILIPPTASHSHNHLLSGTGTMGQLMADVPSELSLTQAQETGRTPNIDINVRYACINFMILRNYVHLLFY
jgi:hypothetical protein